MIRIFSIPVRSDSFSQLWVALQNDLGPKVVHFMRGEHYHIKFKDEGKVPTNMKATATSKPDVIINQDQIRYLWSTSYK